LDFSLKQVYERRKQRRVAEVRLLANKKRLYCEPYAVWDASDTTMLHARDLLSSQCDYQISDSHDGEYQDQGCFLGCHAKWSGSDVTTFLIYLTTIPCTLKVEVAGSSENAGTFSYIADYMTSHNGRQWS